MIRVKTTTVSYNSNRMKSTFKSFILLLTGLSSLVSTAQIQLNFDFDIPYGNNKTVGKYVEINGANIYYEEYGEGEPLFLIHGNSGSIIWMGNQIDYFKKSLEL